MYEKHQFRSRPSAHITPVHTTPQCAHSPSVHSAPVYIAPQCTHRPSVHSARMSTTPQCTRSPSVHSTPVYTSSQWQFGLGVLEKRTLYKSANIVVKTAVRAQKQKTFEWKIEQLELDHKHDNTHILCRTIREFEGKPTKSIIAVKDKQGNTHTNKIKVLKCWEDAIY